MATTIVDATPAPHRSACRAAGTQRGGTPRPTNTARGSWMTKTYYSATRGGRSSRASKVQLLTLVHSALERAPLPLGVERPLKRLHAARQLVEARVVDDQDAVEVVELVLEGLGLGLGLGLLG